MSDIEHTVLDAVKRWVIAEVAYENAYRMRHTNLSEQAQEGFNDTAQERENAEENLREVAEKWLESQESDP